MGLIATAVTHDAKMEQGAQSHQAKLQQMKQKPKPSRMIDEDDGHCGSSAAPRPQRRR
jgi:hypothetical protein